MKTYDFDREITRLGTDSMKWQVAPGELPMWVADMDFQTAPEILQAMRTRLEHGVFGYSEIPEAWYSAYQNWWRQRHGLALERDWLIFSTGVVPAISSMVRKLTTPNENVVIQPPVYNIFYNSILNNGARVLESPLRYEDGQYSMDFADLEKKLADPQTTLMILCDPHNPVGRIWTREELAQVGKLAKKHHVTVISDEIHCDLTLPGRDYVPFAAASEDCRAVSATCIAPTKCFNLAGLQTACVAVPDPFLRHKVWRALNTDEVAEPNAFAAVSAIAAFAEGGPWLDALREYLAENRALAEEYIRREIPGLHAVHGEATYLLWIDISAIADDSAAFAERLRRETGLYVSAGAAYGRGGERFLRMNLATTRARVRDGLERLKRGAEIWRA